jgi:lysophospholipase L1-like esterase
MKRPIKALVGAIALAIAMVACAPPPPPGNNPGVVGDSIVFGAQIHGFMNRMPDAYIDADPGRGVRQPGIGTHRDAWVTVPIVLSHLTPGGWLVLEIGSNDLKAGEQNYGTIQRDLLSQVPPGVCVAWVTVADWSTLERMHNSQIWNSTLNSSAAGRSCFKLIDWYENTRLRTYQLFHKVENGRDTTDYLHPNRQGEAELAQMIDAAT